MMQEVAMRPDNNAPATDTQRRMYFNEGIQFLAAIR
jgi:hypothetical protein